MKMDTLFTYIYEKVKYTKAIKNFMWQNRSLLEMIDKHNANELLNQHFSGIELYKLKQYFDKFRSVDVKNFIIICLKVIQIPI